MDTRIEEATETFAFPLIFKLMIRGTAVVFALAMCLCLPLLLLEPPPGKSLGFLPIFGLVLFGGMLLFTTPLLLRLTEKIHVDEHSITYEAPDGHITTIPWEEVSRVVDRPIMSRLEVHDVGGFTVVRIENQIDRFDCLREIVLQRSGWLERAPRPGLPATLYPNAAYFLIIVASMFLFAGAGVAAIQQGTHAGWLLILIPLASVNFVWISIRVDRFAVIVRYLLWNRTIPLNSIEEFGLETVRRNPGEASLAVRTGFEPGRSS